MGGDPSTATSASNGSPPAAWARSGAPATPCSAARSRSRCSSRSTPTTPPSAPASPTRPGTPRACTTPGIASIFDYGAVEGETPYLVMELVDGRPLSDLLADGPADRPRAGSAAGPPGRRGARRGPPGRRRPPRREAGQPAGHPRRPGEDHRLRHRPRGRLGAVHPDRPDRRHPALPLPRAGTRRAGDGRQRRLRPRRGALRVPQRAPGRSSPTARSPPRWRTSATRSRPCPTTSRRRSTGVVRRALAKDPADRYADGAAFAAALREAGVRRVRHPPPPATTQVLAGRRTRRAASVPTPARPATETAARDGHHDRAAQPLAAVRRRRSSP